MSKLYVETNHATPSLFFKNTLRILLCFGMLYLCQVKAKSDDSKE